MEYPHNIIYEYEKLHDAVHNALAKEIHEFNKEKTMFTVKQFKALEDALCQYGGINGDEMREIIYIAHAHTKKPKYRMKTVDELVSEGFVLRETNMGSYLGKEGFNTNLLEVVKHQINKTIFDDLGNRYSIVFVEITE